MTNSSTLFTRFDRHPVLYVSLAVIMYLLINNTINATSDWMEASRHGNTPPFALWEPFVWEYSSALSTMMLLPLLIGAFQRYPLSLSHPYRFAAVHLCLSVLFSAAHVTLMVWGRKAVYSLQGLHYDFGPLLSEFFYEYRKDLLGYLFWLLMYAVYRFIYARLKGEASVLDKDTEAPEPTKEAPEHVLVRKLDKEFLVKIDSVDWLEASGNYVNLHSQQRAFPLRSTLTALVPRLADKGFVRIHRSFAVNLDQIESIENLPSGDAQVKLRSGKLLPLSRRYKDAFKQTLQ